MGKALKTFFKPQHHLVCRFCTSPIADLSKDKQLIPTDSYMRAEATLSSGQRYRFNGCSKCITSVTPEQVAKAFKADKAVPSQLKSLSIQSIELIDTDLTDAIINQGRL